MQHAVITEQTGDELEQADVRRAQEGDRRAFERLYHRHHGRTYALCLRLLGQVQQAEEAVQDVYLRAWQKLPLFRFEARFSTWLHRLTVNLVLNECKKKPWWRRLVPMDQPHGEPLASATVAGPEAEHQGIDRLLPRLPERARQVFVLFAMEGYSHSEIADVLGIQPGTSKAQYHRARQLLKEMLS